MSDLAQKMGYYRKAVLRLQEGIARYDGVDELARDGLIQRFEFTFELSWKVLKALFEEEGLRGLNSPNSVLREAFAANLIDDEVLWLGMLKDAVSAAQLYDDRMVVRMSTAIQVPYVQALTGMVQTLERRICHQCSP